MNCKYELEVQQTSILNLLYKTMAELLNELGFNIAERLTAYSLRTFTIIN